MLAVMSCSMAPRVASTRNGLLLCAIAVSGSFRPWPVSVQTMVLPSPITPRSRSFSTPAIEVADAGSQKMPSVSASSFCALRISSSLHSLNQPPD